MQTINIGSLLAFILLAFVGAAAHWWKKKRRGEIRGTLLDYLIADKPGSTMSMGLGVLVAAVIAANTGGLDGLAWHYVVDLFRLGQFPFSLLNTVIAALGAGWIADSSLNRGATQDQGIM